MLNWFARRLKEVQEKDKTGQGGFTLIELLVVVIIIGILAAIAIPTFLGQRQRAFNAEANTTARNAATAAKAYFVDNRTYTGMTAAILGNDTNGIEPSLPNDNGAAPYTGTGAIYTVAESGTNFTITVRHPNGNRTFTANDAGVTSTP